MKYFYLLILLTGLCQAAQQQQASQPSPVYRTAPTILNASPQGKSTGPTSTHNTAEEREGQGYVNPQDVKPQVQGAGGVVGSGGVGQTQPLSKPGDHQTTYTVLYYPPQTGSQYSAPSQVQQPLSGQAYSGYQAGGVAPPASEVSSYFSNIKVNDVLMGLLSVGLVGLGGAMWYPKIVGMKTRVMRELSEIKSEDAARMARSVMSAIRKYSELNNARQE